MTDILLAHSYFLKNDPKQIEKMRPYPPLGTLYAAGNLRERGYSVALFDAMLAEGEHEFEALLRRHRPAIVAIHEDQFNFLNKMCLTHSREAACRMAGLARSSGAKVVAAGSDVSDHPEVYFDQGVDYVLAGEADHTLAELVEMILGRREMGTESLAGLLRPSPDTEAGFERNPARDPERHLDVFPFPAWDLVDVERYREAWTKAHGFFSLNMVTTRGCPFHCNWCAKPIWGQRYAMRSPKNVAEELEMVKRTLKPDHIWFADDIFGLQAKWVNEFAHEVEVRDAAVPFMMQSRVDLMKEDVVESLARAGCEEVWMGAESGSQKVLDAMDKGTRVEQIHIARRRLKEAGIKACFFIQFGYPGETFEDIMSTVALVRETLPDNIGVSVSYALPGTKFHRMVGEELGKQDRWTDSADLAMMFQGTYQTDFYRRLHGLLHRDLELRQKRAAGSQNGKSLAREFRELDRQWAELAAIEPEIRSASPTEIQKNYAQPEAPNLKARFN